jgi:hypothetical protein
MVAKALRKDSKAADSSSYVEVTEHFLFLAKLPNMLPMLPDGQSKVLL